MINKSISIYLVLLVAAFVVPACRSTRSETPQTARYKSLYVDQFKLAYFRQLLMKSYHNSIAVQEIIDADHSGFTEPILTKDDQKLIDSLTTIDNGRLQIDSAEGRRRAEGAQGKRPLGFILDKLNSKWLDSLATRRLKVNGVPVGWTE